MTKYPVKLLKDKDGTAFIPVVNSDSIITPEGNTLDDLLEEKQDLLTSGTNIKTINNESLLGSGNISIQGGGDATDVQVNGTSITSGDTANIAVEGTYNASTNKLMTKSEVDGYDASWISTPTPSVADFNAFYNYVENGGIRVYVTSQDDNQINTTLFEGVEIGEWGDEKYIGIYSVGGLLRLICDGTQVTKNSVQLFENPSNKVTSLSRRSRDDQYPSAKCVYDALKDKQDKYNLITDGMAAKTGRQIDGKDEYEVRINCGSGPNKASRRIDFNTENIIITDYYVIGISSGNEIIYAPNSAGSEQYFNVYFTSNVITLSSNQDRSGFTCYAYIKYINKN